MLHDWHQFHQDESTTPTVVDSRRRLRICLLGFVVLLLIVFSRAVQLEVTQGAAFRAEAVRPLQRKKIVPGVRGRILARDGTVLAHDKEIITLAVHYRYLQDPPQNAWLARMVRSRLSRAQRKDPRRVEAEKRRVQTEKRESAQKLSALCGMSIKQWDRRAKKIQARVERIAWSHNRRRRAKAADAPPPAEPTSIFGRAAQWMREALEGSVHEGPLAWQAVAEELDYHAMAEDISPELAARIEDDPQRYPGVRIVKQTRRAYPHGSLAAHVLGHLGKVAKEELEYPKLEYHADDYLGRMGLERQYESTLRGRRGEIVELTDHGGRLLSSHQSRPAGLGQDLTITLDIRLQRAAEDLLDRAVQRRRLRDDSTESAGGAIVVMDVQSGAILAAASAPRFDPNLFLAGNSEELTDLLADPSHPLLDRTIKMAIPPGSVFKIVTAMALLETSSVDPSEPFFCQGYLHEPDRQRCAIYRRQGTGHDKVTLGDALAQSCNVYFFHHAAQMGPQPIIDRALALGFARPTGIDLPDEAAGMIPTPATIRAIEGHAWRPGDTYALAIGQGSVTTTPLQITRLLATIANQSHQPTPHLRESPKPPKRVLAPFSEKRGQDPFWEIGQGLGRVVADAMGTGHGTVYLEEVAIAGKTGTAETGGSRGDHAWFAGYVPAEQPKLAFVVVLQHAGNAATAAGPVAKRLVLQMRKLGML